MCKSESRFKTQSHLESLLMNDGLGTTVRNPCADVRTVDISKYVIRARVFRVLQYGIDQREDGSRASAIF
jgi:hypothetical protein